MKQVLVALVIFFSLPCIAQKALRDSWMIVRHFRGEFDQPTNYKKAIRGHISYSPRGRVFDPKQDNGYILRFTTLSGISIESFVSLGYFTYSGSKLNFDYPDDVLISYFTSIPTNENPRLVELLNSKREVIQSCTVESTPFTFPSQPVYRLDGQSLWIDPAIKSVSLLAPREQAAQDYARESDFPTGVLKLSDYQWKFVNESFLVVDVMQDLWLSHWEARLADLPMKPK